ncbi:MAG: GxGYxYP domain-containing protein, partial [Ktedonobacteraceae bacterium]
MPSMIENNKRLLPVFETPAHLEIYDIQDAAYDVQLSVTTLAGLINRGQPRVYLLSNNDADSLFNALLARVPHEYAKTGKLDVLDAMLQKYRDIVKGMVIYDPAILDSVNVATTMAGLRDAIVVSPLQAASLQQKLYQLPVVADLRIYHWKNRLRAYRWAEDNLLKDATKQVVAGLNPTIAGGLRSYLVAMRAFVYWLNPLNILPAPTSGWVIERCLMKRIIRAYPPGTPHLGWFIHEFAGVDIASKAGLYTLPSDYFFNLEVWSAVQPSVNMEGGSHGVTRAAQAPPPPASATPAPTEVFLDMEDVSHEGTRAAQAPPPPASA